MANDPQTFDELKVALASWSNRDDLDGNLAEFIALAERRLNRRLRVGAMETTATLSATTETVALPADFAGARALYIDGNPDYVLKQMPLSALRELHPWTATGTPEAFAVHGSNIILGPAPSATTSLKLAYWQAITPLSASATTNWLLTAHPDLYIAASMVELLLYTQFTEDAAVWDQRTEAKIDEINTRSKRDQYGHTPLRARAASVA